MWSMVAGRRRHHAPVPEVSSHPLFPPNSLPLVAFSSDCNIRFTIVNFCKTKVRFTPEDTGIPLSFECE